MPHADDAYIVSRSPRGGWRDNCSLCRSLQRIWSGHLRDHNGDHVNAESACTGNADTLQHHGATVPPDNLPSTDLGGTVTETPNLSDEIDRRIRAGWMSFRRYSRELYDRPKASSAASEGQDGDIRRQVLQLRTTHHRMLLRILGSLVQVADQPHPLQ